MQDITFGLKEAMKLKLGVIVPVYNEADGIDEFFGLLIKELEKIKSIDYEVLFVNDGSDDGTDLILKEISLRHANSVRVLNLTRNFGKEAALSAGLHNINTECVVTIDADGQHPPSMIVEFLRVYNEGHDMVVGLRTINRDEKNIKKLGNKLYYRLLKLSGIKHLQPRVTDFRAMSSEVVGEFSKLTEHRRITRGLLDWMGFKTAFVEFESPQRIAGAASYNIKKLAFLAIDSILSNSRKPLAVSLTVGTVISLIGLFGAIFIAVESYLLNDPLGLKFSGASILILTALFMIGLVLISQGIASLYLARIYEEAQQRPLYVIDKKHTTKP